jgi:hypothetical protein
MISASKILRTAVVIAVLGFSPAMVVPHIAYAEPSSDGGSSDSTGGGSQTPQQPHGGGSGFKMPKVEQPKPPVVSCNCYESHPQPEQPQPPPPTHNPVPTQSYVPQVTKPAPTPVQQPVPIDMKVLPAPPPQTPPAPPVYSVKFTSSVDPGVQALTVILMFLFVGAWFYGNRIGSQWALGTPFGKPLGEKKGHVPA